MRNVSKKAQAIFEDTYSTLYSYVRKGQKFDCLSNAVCTTKHTITKSTIKDLKKLCKLEFYRVELRIRHYGASHPSIVARDVEVARRMWLTIQNASREVDKWGSSVTS